MLENPSKNQHFVSQAEQQLNGIPPDRNRIYQFDVVDREKSVLKLVHNDGVSIRNNLAIEDLYSFDISGKLRKNFENLFQKYEQRIKQAVEELENNPSENSLYEIWLLKFLNICRNPHGVKKFLNTFHMMNKKMNNRHLLDPYFLECYQQIDNLQESDLFKGFSDLDLSLEEYKAWLKVLLLLLMPNSHLDSAKPGGYLGNIFEQIAYKLLTNTNTIRAVQLHILSENFHGRFLLNDRSYFYSSEPTDLGELILNFNISDRIAMKFAIFDPQVDPQFDSQKRELMNDPVLKHLDLSVRNSLIEQSLAEMKQDIKLIRVRDNQQEVEQFNQGMIFQARQHVFCSQKEVIGATVLEP